ncbi:MAG: hypothetical protein WA958_00650 [Tunicatimonas sp.]
MINAEKYPELVTKPVCAEQFYEEFKGKLPEKSLLAGFNFALCCDNFHYAFNRYLLHEGKSLYHVHRHIRTFFSDNAQHKRRLALFGIFTNEYTEATKNMLLSREYYELMPKLHHAEEQVQRLVESLFADLNDLPEAAA